MPVLEISPAQISHIQSLKIITHTNGLRNLRKGENDGFKRHIR